MTIKTEGQHTGEFLISEARGNISRDNETVAVAASTLMKAGTVLGKRSSGGKLAEYDNDNTDGTETAAAILFEEADNSAGGSEADFERAVINFAAEVRKADLQWGTGVLAAEKLLAYADLAALGVKAR